MLRLFALRPFLNFLAALWALLALTRSAPAQVVEPNGVSVPGPSSQPTETTLQAYFDSQGEAINAIKEASIEPGTFSPLCDFQAALVLSQSNALAGIAWYNVPATPTGAPAAWYMIVPPGTAVGQTISSADIRSNMNYARGLVGFALIKNGTPAYYSEYRRNQRCTLCTMPDYWKMSLAYRSKKLENTFYVAFEDWEGANDSTWFGNDGDFNDKVFRITGVSCPGGGVACDTGQPGVCAPGLTECQTGGTLTCRPQVTKSDETCDGLDNDCDGTVDDGELCPTDEVCDKGRCVKKCGEVLFNCTNSEVCNAAGYCVDAKCSDVTCTSGLQCINGECKAPCDGVACPTPTVCRVGRCVDPCAGVTCEAGRVCDKGVCVLGCDCAACGTGLECAASGLCVGTGCANQTCAAGTECKAGQCVDACLSAKCPSGQKCSAAACVDACTGVTCPTGQKCVSGSCADACSDVSCGPGLKCVPGTDSKGSCVDACLGVDCGTGKKCQNGVCGSDCLGVSCPTGEVCMAGACVNPCASVTCAATEVCRSGACVDRCQGVTCGFGTHCELGVCTADQPTVPTSGGAFAAGGSASGGAMGGSNSALGGASSSRGGSTSTRGSGDTSGCGCRLSPTPPERALTWLISVSLLGLALRRRRGQA
ncbi:MAG: hypothetical protein QM756_47005 [Polyangiaceae bacterium]